MLQVRIKGDAVTIEGYVNAIERKSKPLMSRIGQFVERIKKGAFKRAISRNDNIKLLLNHDWQRELGSTQDGTLELTEDNIGLRARAKITDPDVVQKARNGELVGWSFGFTDREVDKHDEGGIPTRDVKDLNLYEVSILDRSKKPAYEGTLVSVRSDDEAYYHGAMLEQEINIREEQTEAPEQREEPKEEPKEIDYTKYEKLIQEMKEETL